MGRNLGLARETGAKVEIGRDGDIGRNSLDVESAEEARINTDIGEIVLPGHDLPEGGRKLLHRIVRKAPEDDHTARARGIADQLLERLWRHRQAGKHYELGCFALPHRRVRRGARYDFVEVDRTSGPLGQIGLRNALHVGHATVIHIGRLLAERITPVLHLIDERLGISLKLG